MNRCTIPGRSRRDFLRAGVSLAGMSLLGANAARAQSNKAAGTAQAPRESEEQLIESGPKEPEPSVGPTEDLMREHGVVTRMLLIYEEVARRLEAGARDLSPDPLKQTAGLVRSFVEDYHEKLEERYLFPRFRGALLLVELVDTLQTQHDAGRRVTDTVLHLATQAAFKDEGERRKLTEALRQFIRMYLPHASREDTVLFPAFHKLMSPDEYRLLGDQFEDREHELFGSSGFFGVVDRVAGIEKLLGIYDLAQFTPKP